MLTVLVPASPAAALTDYTWTGGTPLSTSGASNWSNATNWGGSSLPGYSSVGTLSFPALPGCNQSVDTCYTSYNDLLSLSANAISIDDGVPYDLPGIQHVSLGSGGLTAAPSASDTGSDSPIWNVPLILNADQTWSITGGSSGQQLEIDSQISGSSTLGVDLASGGFLDLGSTDDVGAVTISGNGAVALGYPGQSAGLNAILQNPVTVTGGADLLAAEPSDGSGPLTVAGGVLQVGFAGQAGTLIDNGSASLDSGSAFVPFIAQSGTTAGTDYSQLSASGTVNLGGAQLDLVGQEAAGGQCLELNVGDVIDLVTTTGSLTGTFAGVPDGATVPVDCNGGVGTPATVRINYTSNSVTATVLTSGVNGSSTTTLSPSPASPTTNQTVTLTATVTDQLSAPAGTVSFLNHGAAIASCSHQPVALSGGSYVATCQTSFVATSSPEALTATFTPSSSSQLASTSATDNQSIGKAPTTTAIVPPAPEPAPSAWFTYKATVTAAYSGSAAPIGKVEFFKNGTPIWNCPAQPLTPGTSSFTATCQVSSAENPAGNSITATYSGDQNFASSTSAGTSPWNNNPPVVFGWYTLGRTLWASYGSWWGVTPMSYVAQWQRCRASGCVAIPGATGDSYLPTAADLGDSFRVEVTVTNNTGSSSAVSNEYGPMIGSRAQVKASLAQQIVPRGRAAKIAAVLKATGYRLRFTALDPGSALIQWYVSVARGHRVLIAVGRLKFTAVGTRTMKVKLTHAGKELLAHARILPVIATAIFRPSGIDPTVGPTGAVYTITPIGLARVVVQRSFDLKH